MKTQSFTLVPSREYVTEIERIAGQYPGFKHVSIYGYADTNTLAIHAHYFYLGEPLPIMVHVRNHKAMLEDNAALLMAKLGHELAKTFEIDLIPVENY